jgi:hypothetical protein
MTKYPWNDIHSVLDDIIEGKSVKRSKHELIFEGRDISDLFIETLLRHHYLPVTVDQTTMEPGERIPAFYLENHTAYFGWIFWEKFSQLRLRKLFGTVVRNTKGDWLIQLPSSNTKIIYADTSQIFEMEIDRPFEL